MPRSLHGGRHELGQNFLTHQPTIDRIANLARRTRGPILEIGCGDGALTRALAKLGRPLTAIDIDEHLVARVAKSLPRVRVEQADILRHPLDSPVIVGNVPFHLTTAIMRRLLASERWHHAIVLTQWEVARRRAGVGGRTMLTAQTSPWYEFSLEGRVGARSFTPRPNVDGGLLRIARRTEPLVSRRDRQRYERFVKAIFTGPGGSIDRIVGGATRSSAREASRALDAAKVSKRALPRDLEAAQWAALWAATSHSRASP